MSFGELLFRAARRLSASRTLGKTIGLGFGFLSPLLPVKRVLEDEHFIAFPHPRPAFPDHILLVPKKAVATFVDLLEPGNEPQLRASILGGREIVRQQKWSTYSFGVNCGAYQDVAQVHFHLYEGTPHYEPLGDTPPGYRVLTAHGQEICHHPSPNRKTHLVMRVSRYESEIDSIRHAILEILDSTPALRFACTIFIEFPSSETEEIIFHLVSDG